ncbi:MAG TPA: hypothetical protein PLV52_03120, partial [Candidatus Omnitrophota bacterium]|nr:hypothetical protein [Candidatus Omnitrophota bacterium]
TIEVQEGEPAITAELVVASLSNTKTLHGDDRFREAVAVIFDTPTNYTSKDRPQDAKRYRAIVSSLEQQIKIGSLRTTGKFIGLDDNLELTETKQKLIFDSPEDVIGALTRQLVVIDKDNWPLVGRILGFTGGYDGKDKFKRAAVSLVESQVIISGKRTEGARIPNEDLTGFETTLQALTFTDIKDVLATYSNQVQLIDKAWSSIQSIFGLAGEYAGKNRQHRAVLATLESQIALAERQTGTVVLPEKDLKDVTKEPHQSLKFEDVKDLIKNVIYQASIVKDWSVIDSVLAFPADNPAGYTPANKVDRALLSMLADKDGSVDFYRLIYKLMQATRTTVLPPTRLPPMINSAGRAMQMVIGVNTANKMDLYGVDYVDQAGILYENRVIPRTDAQLSRAVELAYYLPVLHQWLSNSSPEIKNLFRDNVDPKGVSFYPVSAEL